MTENQLKLNDDKTEALLLSFFSSSKPAAISLHNIPFSDSVRNLGFILDSELSMKKHAIKICQTAYFELKRISSIRRFLTEDTTKTLVTSYVLSRIDFCNCLSIDAPNSVIQPPQKVKKNTTLMQDSFSWHLVITLHLSWKSRTGFPFQSALNTKLHACASML